jgi:hypothetical protein
MKSPLHNVNQGTRLFAKCAVVVALAFVAITSAHTRGAEPAPTLSGPSFIPDGRASTLAGWHTLGQAAWRADQGELVGNGTNGAGWLVFDRAFQDTGLYTAFECSGSCDTGVLLRLRPTSDGMQGTFLAITDGDLKGYTLTLDRDGNQVQQKELRSAGGQIRFAPPPPDPSAPAHPVRFPTLPSAPPGVTIPITRPEQGIRKEEWNEIELLLDADILRAFMNNGGGQASVATDEMNGYGSIALYVGKGCEVRFKNVAYKDLAIKKDPPEEVGSRFRMQRLSPFYYGWSAAAADFNHDGKWISSPVPSFILVPTI